MTDKSGLNIGSMRQNLFHVQGENTSFQKNLFRSLQMVRKIEGRYAQLPEFVEGSFKEGGSQYTLFNEITTKYSPKGMLQLFDSPMLFKLPGSAVSEVHLNIQTSIPISLTFAHTLEAKSLALWYSPVERAKVIKESLRAIGIEPKQFSKVVNLRTQIVEALPGMTGDQFQFINMSTGEKGLERSESDAPHLTSVPLIYLQNAERALQKTRKDAKGTKGNEKLEIITERFNNQFHQIKTTLSKAMAGTVPGAIPPTHFWNWFQQRRAVNISQIQSMMPMVFAQSALLREVVSSSRDNTITAIEKSLNQGFQTGMLAHPKILTKIFDRDEFATVQMLESSNLGERLKPIANEWLVPVINQRLVESTLGSTSSSVADGAEDEISQFSVIRREEQMEPPSLNYAFAQPMRPIAREEHVMTRVQEKEVVKLIQNEVESQMTSRFSVMSFSRADYARIADNVYSSLARRLMLEKERLGLR